MSSIWIIIALSVLSGMLGGPMLGLVVFATSSLIARSRRLRRWWRRQHLWPRRRSGKARRSRVVRGKLVWSDEPQSGPYRTQAPNPKHDVVTANGAVSESYWKIEECKGHWSEGHYIRLRSGDGQHVREYLRTCGNGPWVIFELGPDADYSWVADEEEKGEADRWLTLAEATERRKELLEERKGTTMTCERCHVPFDPKDFPNGCPCTQGAGKSATKLKVCSFCQFTFAPADKGVCPNCGDKPNPFNRIHITPDMR